MKWIDVKTELPELSEFVLVYNTEGATLVARRMIPDWVALFADGEKSMGELAATHWMPLPEPPKTKAECVHTYEEVGGWDRCSKCGDVFY